MLKRAIYEQELEKLGGIFKDIEESKRKLVEGLIDDAAFLKAENCVLKKLLDETGMIKVHPINKEIQRPTEAAKQYLKNINAYSVVIKVLNGILSKSIVEDDDELDDYE